jgi:hypothetical protein
VNEEWWVMMGKDPDRPLDGPFETVADAAEFARLHHHLGDAQLIRYHNGEPKTVMATDPRDLS